MIKVRKAIQKDADQLVFLMRELIEGEENDPAAVRNELEQMEQDDHYFLAVACEGKTIVGSIMGVLCRDICKGCRPFLVIENVITKDGWRGKGVGCLLFETVEQWGKDHRCAYSMLVSGCNRTGAHVFYEQIGYSKACGFRKYFD